MKIYYKNNELYHYGIKGMRWGVRKATATDKRRIGDAGTAANVFKSSQSGIEGASKVAGGVGNLSRGPSKKVKKEMSKMSDAELRSRINRQMMEQQYASLNPNKVQRGASTVKSILDIAGGVAAIAGSAATVYMAMKKARLHT